MKNVVEKNDDYWGGDVKLAGAEFYPGEDEMTRSFQLYNNEVDFSILNIPITEYENAKTKEQLDVFTLDCDYTHIMILNTTKAPFDNKDVRHAFSYAINCIRDSFYGAAGDFYRCRRTKADTTAISVGICFYVTAVDGDVGTPETPNPISVSIFANASSCRYIAAVDGDAAAAPRTNRICGSISHDRAAIDGNTATVTVLVVPDPNVAGSSMYCYRFGADNAAIDGNAAVLLVSRMR